jgi:hypothetical protein
MPMLDVTNARRWNVRGRSIKIMLRLGLAVVRPGAFGAAQAESIPTDSPRWQLKGTSRLNPQDSSSLIDTDGARKSSPPLQMISQNASNRKKECGWFTRAPE